MMVNAKIHYFHQLSTTEYPAFSSNMYSSSLALHTCASRSLFQISLIALRDSPFTLFPTDTNALSIGLTR